MDKINLASVRQNFAQCVFTHQVQEAAAGRKLHTSGRYKLLNVLVVALVLVLLVGQAFNPDNLMFTYIGAVVTIVEIALLIIQLMFNADQEATAHKSSALKYMALRGKYENLIADIMNGDVTPDAIRARRDSLRDEYQSVSDMSPVTTSVDYTTAQQRLGLTGNDEQYTWSAEEINRFLPKELRTK